MESETFNKAGYLKDNFRLFHLTDTNPLPVSYHYHDFYKVFLLLKGDVTYHIEGKTYDLKPYDLVLVNAGEIHKPVISSTFYERMILYISPDFLEHYKESGDLLDSCFTNAENNHSHVLRVELFAKSRLYETLVELEASLTQDDFASDLYQNTLFLQFLILLNRASMDSYSSAYVPNSHCNSKILPILEYIAEHLVEDLSVDTLSSKFYMSRYYLMHLFKKETGYSVANYISTKRLLHARALIQSGTSVTEACFASGFKNYSTFSRAYKKLFLSSAREHR